MSLLPETGCRPRASGAVGTAGDHVLVFFLFTVKHEEKLQSGLDQTREFAVTSWAQRPALPVGGNGIHDPTVASVEEGGDHTCLSGLVPGSDQMTQ